MAADGDGAVLARVRVPYEVRAPAAVRGERTPQHRRDLRAALDGIALHHGPAHLLRAADEAAGFVVRHHLDLARAAGLAPRRIVATRSGTQVPPRRQALAIAIGLPVEVTAVPDGAALGSAFVARCVAGLEGAMTDGPGGPGRPARWAPTQGLGDIEQGRHFTTGLQQRGVALM